MILPVESQQLHRHDGRKNQTTVWKGKEEIESVAMDGSLEVGQTMKKKGGFVFLVIFVLLGSKPRVLCMLGRSSTSEVPTQQEKFMHEELDHISSLR